MTAMTAMAGSSSPVWTDGHAALRTEYRPTRTRTTSAEIARFATILGQAETEIVKTVVDVMGGDGAVYPDNFAHTLRASISSLTEVLIRSVETCGWHEALSGEAPSVTRSVEAFGTVEAMLRTAQGFSQEAFAGLLHAYHSAYLAVVYESSVDWEAACRYRGAVDRFFGCLRQTDNGAHFSRPRAAARPAGRFPRPARDPDPTGAPRDGSGTPVVLLDAAGRLEWANRAGARLFGLSAALREPAHRRPSVSGRLDCLQPEIEAFARGTMPEFILVWPLETALGRRAYSTHFVRRSAPDGSSAGMTIAFNELDVGAHADDTSSEERPGAPVHADPPSARAGRAVSSLAYRREGIMNMTTTTGAATLEWRGMRSTTIEVIAACVLGASLLLLLLFLAPSALASGRIVSPDAPPGNSTGDGGWAWQNPLPNGNDLSQVAFADARSGWALDPDGRLLRTTDGGATWTGQVPGLCLDLEALAVADATHAWAVGGFGTIVSTSDGGARWREAACLTDDDLHDVAFVDATRGWVVGDGGLIMRSTDGGQRWRPQSSGAMGNLYGVCAVSASDAWAVGDNRIVTHTTDGGATWLPRMLAGDFDIGLSSIQFVSAKVGWIVADDSQILRTVNGGETWVSGGSTAFGLLACDFVSETVGWGVGYGGVIARTTDGGVSWRIRPSPTMRELAAVDFIDADTGWAVGGCGTIVRTTTAGAQWTVAGSGPSMSLRALAVVDPQKAVAVGEPFDASLGLAAPSALTTTDGGASWPAGDAGPRTLFEVTFTDSIHGWAVGAQGAIEHSADGGASWTAQTSGTAEDLLAVCFLHGRRLWSHGWAGGAGGTFLSTRDAGQTWTPEALGTSGDVTAMFFADDRLGWIIIATYDGNEDADVYSSEVRQTTDGGATWQTVLSAPTYLADIDFADAATGWIVGGYGDSAAYQTTDGGATWAPRDVGVDDLEAVEALDDRHCWVAGGSGEVAHTYDGGALWWSESTGTSLDLHDIGFVDATTGWVVGDGGAILKTTSGGARPDSIRPQPVARASVSVKRGAKAVLPYRVNDASDLLAAVTITIATPSGTPVKSFALGKRPTGTDLKLSFPCTLRRGTYIFSVAASDAAGNREEKVGSRKLYVY